MISDSRQWDTAPEELCGIGATFDRCHLSGKWRIEKILDHVSLVSDDRNAQDDAGGSDAPCILPGDQILSIDNRSATDLSPQDFAKLIMGPEGSCVALTLCRVNDDDAAASQGGAPAQQQINVVARRGRRTAPFFQPLSASAEGLKAVFRLLSGGGTAAPGEAASPHSSPKPARGGNDGSMVFF